MRLLQAWQERRRVKCSETNARPRSLLTAPPSAAAAAPTAHGTAAARRARARAGPCNGRVSGRAHAGRRRKESSSVRLPARGEAPVLPPAAPAVRPEAQLILICDVASRGQAATGRWRRFAETIWRRGDVVGVYSRAQRPVINGCTPCRCAWKGGACPCGGSAAALMLQPPDRAPAAALLARAGTTAAALLCHATASRSQRQP